MVRDHLFVLVDVIQVLTVQAVQVQELVTPRDLI